MPFKEMTFRGNRVFVEVDEKGEIIQEEKRARMKYRLEDDMIYQPYIGNLEEARGGSGKTVSASPGAKAGRKPRKPPVSRPEAGADDREAIVAYTDGACLGNPGPAGLGYLIMFPDGRRLEQGEPLGKATNNIAELTAILRVLEITREEQLPLVIYSDSSYSLGVLTKGWKAKANQSLIATTKAALRKISRVELRKVKGHAGIEENEIVDQLARSAADLQKTV